MKADGWSDERIAHRLGISRPTLYKNFARELEFGADKVRLEMLANLRRQAKRNAGAADKLLRRADVIAVPTSTQVDKPEEKTPPAPALGKKERADLDAQDAEAGTSWSKLVN